MPSGEPELSFRTSEAVIRSVFYQQNPWNQTGMVPPDLRPEFERWLVEPLTQTTLKETLKRFRLILGPRRVGKTTAMYQVVHRLVQAGIKPTRLHWWRLDHPYLVQESLGELLRWSIRECKATPEEPLIAFLDEVTYSDNWDGWLKTAYDEHWPVRIIATSSSAAALKERRVESGIGRWTEHSLTGLSLYEWAQITKQQLGYAMYPTLRETLIQQAVVKDTHPETGAMGMLILFGGFPELMINLKGTNTDKFMHQIQAQIRADSLEKVIWKDIRQAVTIDDPQAMERLVYTLAGQLGGIFKPESVCSSVGNISKPTLGRYLHFLEQAFLLFTVPNYSASEEAVQRRGRKVYFYDVAVRNAALQLGFDGLLPKSEGGLILENFVATALQAVSQFGGGRLFYWRDRDTEVDFVLDHPTDPLAIEVGLSFSHDQAGLRRIAERFPRFGHNRFIVSISAPGPEVTAPEGIKLLSVEGLLWACGAHAHKMAIDSFL